MNIPETIYLLAGLTLVISFFFFWLSSKVKYDEPRNQYSAKAHNTPKYFFLLGSFFFFLAFTVIVVGTGYTFTAPLTCESVVNSSTVTNNTTSYTYVNTCEGNTYLALEYLYSIYGWILGLFIISSVVYLLYKTYRLVADLW